MVTGCNTDSGLEINSEVLRIYERYRENLSDTQIWGAEGIGVGTVNTIAMVW